MLMPGLVFGWVALNLQYRGVCHLCGYYILQVTSHLVRVKSMGYSTLEGVGTGRNLDSFLAYQTGREGRSPRDYADLIKHRSASKAANRGETELATRLNSA